MSLQPTKTPEQIEAMRQGGQILAQLLVDLKNYVQPGMTGCQIDAWLEQEILKRGAEVTYKDPAEGVDFPASICISVNENIVHGLPNDIPLERGDVAKFDLVITYHDMKVDSAFTMVVGEEPSGSKKHLLNNVEKSPVRLLRPPIWMRPASRSSTAIFPMWPTMRRMCLTMCMIFSPACP